MEDISHFKITRYILYINKKNTIHSETSLDNDI